MIDLIIFTDVKESFRCVSNISADTSLYLLDPKIIALMSNTKMRSMFKAGVMTWGIEERLNEEQFYNKTRVGTQNFLLRT